MNIKGDEVPGQSNFQQFMSQPHFIFIYTWNKIFIISWISNHFMSRRTPFWFMALSPNTWFKFISNHTAIFYIRVFSILFGCILNMPVNPKMVVFFTSFIRLDLSSAMFS